MLASLQTFFGHHLGISLCKTEHPIATLPFQASITLCYMRRCRNMGCTSELPHRVSPQHGKVSPARSATISGRTETLTLLQSIHIKPRKEFIYLDRNYIAHKRLLSPAIEFFTTVTTNYKEHNSACRKQDTYPLIDFESPRLNIQHGQKYPLAIKILQTLQWSLSVVAFLECAPLSIFW